MIEDQKKVIELEEKINELEKKLSSSVIYEDSLIKRALGIFGHNIFAQLILFIPMIIIFSFFSGIFSELFFPDIIDQGW